jgi:hypothetical protein
MRSKLVAATTAEAGGEESGSHNEMNATIVAGWVSVGEPHPRTKRIT